MHAVKEATAAGCVPAEAFNELRRQFNQVQLQAVKLFGEAVLLQAVRALDPEGYRPPLPDEPEKSQAVRSVPAKASPETERLARARQLVHEIRDETLALGWKAEALYFCDGYERHPIGQRYGLVCYIGADCRIGEVTRQSIELIGPSPMETRSRFYNPDVEQPWIRKTGSEIT